MFSRFQSVPMSKDHVLIWNAQGLNSRAHRSVVREFVIQEHMQRDKGREFLCTNDQ